MIVSKDATFVNTSVKADSTNDKPKIPKHTIMSRAIISILNSICKS